MKVAAGALSAPYYVDRGGVVDGWWWMVAGDRQRDGGRRTVVGVDSVVYRQRDFFCPRLTDDGLGRAG